MRFLTFLALCLIAMLICGLYGAIHDQISFTVSSEYFTKFKYNQFGFVHSPLPDRAKAALIGFLATWWMGVPIGIIVGGSGFIHRPFGVMFQRTLRAYAVAAIVTLLIGLAGLAYGSLFASHHPADYLWYFPEDLGVTPQATSPSPTCTTTATSAASSESSQASPPRSSSASQPAARIQPTSNR